MNSFNKNEPEPIIWMRIEFIRLVDMMLKIKIEYHQVTVLSEIIRKQ